MSTKSERQAEQDAAQRRLDAVQAEADRQTHLVDPLTHPSSGDPPPAISPAGDRLGAVPLTRNAVADVRQAEQEGMSAAEKNQPTKAEREASKPRPASGKRSGRRSGDSKRAALAGKSTDQNTSTADASKATLTASSTEKIAAKRDEAAEKTQTPSLNRPPSGTRPAAEGADKH